MITKLKKRMYRLLSLSLLIGTTVSMTISCGNSNNSEKDSVLFSRDNKIIIASAIPKTWPQYNSLKNIVKDYNENHKNEDGFIEVVFLGNEETKTESGNYGELSSKVNKLVSSGSNNIPNMMISNFNEVYELSGYDKLLNLENEGGIDRSIFDDKFVTNRTKLKTEKYIDGLWAVPITVTTNSSVVFNMPVMKVLLELMENHGATIGQAQPNVFMNAIMNNTNNIDSYIGTKPDGYKDPSTLWQDHSTNLNVTDLDNYTINDSTFKTLEGLYDFSMKARDSLELTQAPYIAGSYFMNDFLTSLDSDSGATNASFPLYRAKTSGKGFDFPFLINDSADETKVKVAFKNMLKPIIDGAMAPPETFNVGGIRNGQHAIATMPAVSARYSYQNANFGAYAGNGFAFEDMYYLPQISTYSSKTSTSYSLAESSLLGIKTTSQKDKAVLNFIHFIYQGKMKDKTKVVDYLEQSSGYVVPLKEKMTPAAIQDITSKYEALKNDPTDNEHTKGAINRSLLNTYQSINNGKYRTLDGDQYTSKLLSIIKNTFDTIIENPQDWNWEKFISEINKHENEFNT
ncbi:hypothetical protein [Candidatus Mycoplasma mahonii]|uniref:hypothetical protein n=1 Tax=Candidatus Mycoplasma mahonii TaxID=3004105 RepID=UPI0026F21D64|nr:hypothetical protein [Candidatus Mycoplasma mahonii]WKX02177.1 hypothetical protein O3I44_02120 [Candidatus Mycoplasma mahonii]